MTRTAQLAMPILWVVLSLLLSACKEDPPEPLYLGPPLTVDLAPCGGNEVIRLVGQPVNTMPATGGWSVKRVIWPGMAVTEDYSESRLNVEVDAKGIIRTLSCG